VSSSTGFDDATTGAPRGQTGKVVWHMTMSLDGFIAGPHGPMDLVLAPSEAREVLERSAGAREVIETTGAFLTGRGTFPHASAAAHVYLGAWTGPVFILTHRPPASPPDGNATFLSCGVSEAVATALAAAKGKNVVVAGAGVAKQCIAAGLVDEFLIHVVPVLLGDGVPLFASPATERIKLARLGLAESGQVTDLRFRVANTPVAAEAD
jgi:dihydrofolate reductase